MRNPLVALVWELWRVSRWELAVRIAGPCLLVVLMVMLTSKSALPLGGNELNVLQGISVVILVITSIFSTSWLSELDNTQNGFSFRLGFTRPLSTCRLVVVPMVYFVLTAAACYVVPAAFLRLALGAELPLALPAAIVVVSVACCVAAVWSPTTRTSKLLIVAAVAGTALMSMIRFLSVRSGDEPVLLAMGRPQFYQIDAGWYLLMPAITAAATAITVWAVDRQRHGEDVPWRGWGRRLPAFENRLPRVPRPFSGPIAAQLWYEMRRSGLKIMLAGLVLPALMFVSLAVIRVVNPGWAHGAAVWIVAVATCPAVYLLIGSEWSLGLKRKQGAVALSKFDATQGMRNDMLIGVKLAVITASTLFGLAAMAAGGAIDAGLRGEWSVWKDVVEGLRPLLAKAPVLWSVAMAVSATYLFLTGGALLLAFGLWVARYRKHLTYFMAFAWVNGAVAVWDLTHGRPLALLWTVYQWAMAGGVVVGGGIITRRAVARGHLHGPSFLASGLLWAVFVVSAVAAYRETAGLLPPISAAGWAMILAALTVPPASIAAAPMALAIYRHG